MRFCCAACGRIEEILLDRAPRCLYCDGTMVAESSYADVWISPLTAIRRIVAIRETYGTETARTHRRFQKEREAWTTAALALALTKLTGELWWIEIETVESTPDTRLVRIEQSSGRNIVQMRCVEVVDWQANVEDIMTVITKKCERAYPRNYLLAVHARHGGKVLEYERIAEQIMAIGSPFLEIWVVAVVEPAGLTAVRVAPFGPAVDLLSEDFARVADQPAFLKRGNRGTSTEFYDLLGIA